MARAKKQGARPSAGPMNPMAEQVGPEFYDAHAMTEALTAPDAEPVTLAELEELRTRHEVLGVRTADERWIYPTWQVDDAVVLPGLAEVLTAFAGHPAWSVGVWLRTPREELGDRTPHEALVAGGDVTSVVDLAAVVAARWA